MITSLQGNPPKTHHLLTGERSAEKETESIREISSFFNASLFLVRFSRMQRREVIAQEPMGKHIAASNLDQEDPFGCIVEKTSTLSWKISRSPEIPTKQIMLHPGNASKSQGKLERQDHTKDQGKGENQDWPSGHAADRTEGQSTCYPTRYPSYRAKQAGGKDRVFQ